MRAADISTEEQLPADADNLSFLSPSIQKFDNEFLPSGLSADLLTHRPFRQAQGPSIFLGVLRSGVSLSNPEALEGQAQGGEEDRTTMSGSW